MAKIRTIKIIDSNPYEEAEKGLEKELQDGNDYIYLFPLDDINATDIRIAKRYGLTTLGKNFFNGERNLVMKGSLNNLKRYCKEYLGYEMHPDYLYKENEFGGDIKDACKDSYYSDKDKQNKEFVKNAISEMNRYIRNWNFMSAHEKQEIGCSLAELKSRVKELESVNDACKDSTCKDIIINGGFKDWNPSTLIAKMKETRNADMHTNRKDKQGNIHTIFVSMSGNVENAHGWVDIVVEKPDGSQDRVLTERANSWKDAIRIMEKYKRQHINDSVKDVYEEKVVNGYVIGKFANGGYSVYNNQGHFEEDKNNGYKTEAEAIKRAKSLPKGIAIGDSIKDKHQKMIKMINVVKGFKDAKVKDYDERILNKLKEIAQQGEKLKPEYENFMFKIKRHMGSTYQQIQEFKKEYPRKYDLIKSQEENLNKKVETLAKEWNKYIDLIARGSNMFPRAINSLPTMTIYNQVLGEIQNLQERKGKKPWEDSKVKDNMVYTEKNGIILIIKDGKVIVKFPDKKSAIEAGYDIDNTIKRK